MNDDELVDGLIRREPAAEREFDRWFRPIIATVIAALPVPPQDADDLVQMALLKALRAIQQGTFRGEASLKTWITRITVNVFLDYRRRQQRNEGLAVAEPTILEHLPSARRDPDQAIALQRALRRLRPLHRVVLLLLARGCTTVEIARVIRKSPGRTGAIMVDARHALRAALAAEGFGLE